ncbi:MAG: hypothetical protein ACXWDJ_10570 [Aeromicrobium sp.]
MTDQTPEKTVSVEFAGKTWTIPVKLRFSQMEALRDDMSDVGIVRALLDDAQLAEFRKLDLDEDEVDKFTDALAEAKRVGSKGNS